MSKWKKLHWTCTIGIGLCLLWVWIVFCGVDVRAASGGTVYRLADGTAVNGAYAKGIDVSKNNGEIDWKAVRASGISFAIIRCGYGSDDPAQDDARWEENVAGAQAAGIPFGVYLYSYTDTKAKARSEAQHVLRLIQGKKLSYPVYYDMEEPSIFAGTTAAQRGKIAQAFCNVINAAGYKTAVYASKYHFESVLTDPVFDKLGRWVAHYNTKCGYGGTYQVWQATNKGTVPGIKGNVDIDYLISNQIFVKPSLTVKAVGSRKVKVNWKPKKAGTTCEIYYSTSKKGKWKCKKKSGASGAMILKGLRAGKTWYFKIRISRKVQGTVVYSKYSAVKKCKSRR